MRCVTASFALNLSFALLAAQSATAQKFAITDLGTLPGGTESVGNGINSAGQMTGSSLVPGPCLHNCMHAFLYSNGKMLDLGTLPGGNSSVGSSINSGKDPEVVGYSEVAGGALHAFLWNAGHMLDLGTFSGGGNSVANAIDQFGDITGNAQLAAGNFHAFLYSRGTMHDLGTLPGGTYSGGYGINRVEESSGGIEVVGYGDVPGDCSFHVSCPYHAFLYSHGAMHDLGTLPGGFFSNATAINQFGQITGSADNSEGNFHAFLYEHGVMRDLGTLPNGFQSFATAMNKHAQIVGYGSVDSINNFHAFVYRNGKMQDLNNLIPSNSGWFLGFAFGINDHGQITGAGIINGEGHAFLLTPVGSHNNDQNGEDNDQN
jgi:probable HAF family extracellular repeat protein